MARPHRVVREIAWKEVNARGKARFGPCTETLQDPCPAEMSKRLIQWTRHHFPGRPCTGRARSRGCWQPPRRALFVQYPGEGARKRGLPSPTMGARPRATAGPAPQMLLPGSTRPGTVGLAEQFMRGGGPPS